MHSVQTEAEAKHLLTLACSTNLDGEYVAEELAGPGKQTLENLNAFGRRLAATEEWMNMSPKKRGQLYNHLERRGVQHPRWKRQQPHNATKGQP